MYLPPDDASHATPYKVKRKHCQCIKCKWDEIGKLVLRYSRIMYPVSHASKRSWPQCQHKFHISLDLVGGQVGESFLEII